MPKPRRKKGSKEVTIPFQFSPRDYQIDLYNAIPDGFRRGVTVWHRRAGKDKTYINVMAREMYTRVGSYFYFLPTYAQGKKIIWDGRDKDGMKFLDHIPAETRKRTNETEMKIELENGSIFQVVGSDSFDSIMGTNPIGCVFSEYSIQDPRAWDYIRPILAENGGWAFFPYTPRGKNHGWKLYQMAMSNPDWFCEVLTVNDTHAIGYDAIDAERKAGMSEDMIQQEFFCSFDASLPGAYYAKEMMDVRTQGRITRVAIENDLPVYTAWDLGIDDSMSIWLFQYVGREIHLVGYYENRGESFQHYLNWLNGWRVQKRLTWGKHYLPHDGSKRELQTGRSAQQYLTEHGFDAECVTRPQSKEVAIEEVRRILPRCWFDEDGCSRGIDCLCSYHAEEDKKHDVFKAVPVHDWAAHGNDAFQTMMLGTKREPKELTKREQFLTGDGLINQHIRFGGNPHNSWMGAK